MWRGEVLHYARNHTEIAVDWALSTIQDINGKVIGTVSIARDITARKEAECALKKSESAIPNAGKDHCRQWCLEVMQIGVSISLMKRSRSLRGIARKYSIPGA